MGNDQVRFDLAVKASGGYRIVAPIREIQKEHTQTRAYEQQYLEERGFGVRPKQKAYTINENLLGLTRSEEHTSELQSLMRIPYAVFCLKKKKQITSSP